MVEVFRRDLSVVWQWSVLEHITWEPLTGGDWSHCNSVTVDSAANAFYLSCRNFDNIYKISLTGSMDILSRYGAGGDYAADPSADEPWFAEQHDPEIQQNGNILIYDNGTVDRGHSRVVEYAFDDASKKAAIVWEFPGSFTVDAWYRDNWFTNHWGDADKQPNGNVLVTAGNLPGTGGAPSRVFEVTKDGEVVWEIAFSNSGIYRSQRISPPLVESLLESAAVRSIAFESRSRPL